MEKWVVVRGLREGSFRSQRPHLDSVCSWTFPRLNFIRTVKHTHTHTPRPSRRRPPPAQEGPYSPGGRAAAGGRRLWAAGPCPGGKGPWRGKRGQKSLRRTRASPARDVRADGAQVSVRRRVPPSSEAGGGAGWTGGRDGAGLSRAPIFFLPPPPSRWCRLRWRAGRRGGRRVSCCGSSERARQLGLPPPPSSSPFPFFRLGQGGAPEPRPVPGREALRRGPRALPR